MILQAFHIFKFRSLSHQRTKTLHSWSDQILIFLLLNLDVSKIITGQHFHGHKLLSASGRKQLLVSRCGVNIFLSWYLVGGLDEGQSLTCVLFAWFLGLGVIIYKHNVQAPGHQPFIASKFSPTLRCTLYF